MSEKQITRKQAETQKKELVGAKKQADDTVCGNEPIVLERPKQDGNDPSCGNAPFVLDKPGVTEPDDPCGNGRDPKLPRPGHREPLDPRLVNRTKNER